MNQDYEILFTPAKIGKLELKNRFVMVPMHPTSFMEWTQNAEGLNPEKEQLYLDRAKDGIGLIITGCFSFYCFKNRECLADHPEAFAGVREFMDKVHSYGTRVFVQMTAGMGRNHPVTKEMYANMDKLNETSHFDITTASADEGLPNRWIPEYKTKKMTVEHIHQVVEDFARTALLCKEAGIDGIDVHAVHEGYLLDQFAAPYTNHRTDEYGGSLENRLRFACEIVKAIKEKCGQDYPVIIRYSVVSRTRGFGKGIIPQDNRSKEIGRDIEESKKAIRILSDAGYDAINADNGTYDSWYYAHPPVYMPLNCNLQDAITVSPYTDKPIICAGRMQLHEAAEAIRKDQIQFVGIGRQFLTDEQYLTKIREEREEDIRPCIGCHLGCMGYALWKDSGAVIGSTETCALNPYCDNEKKYAVRRSKDPKHFAVIGGGIAGMEFAIQAKKRGHKVDIYEKSDRLAGVFNEASAFSFKEKDRELIRYYKRQIEKENIPVYFNTEITDISSVDADEIVVATGAAETRRLSVPGAEYAVSALDFLKNGMVYGENIVIIGGGLTGCEIAYELAKSGKKPVLVEMQDDILKVPGVCMANTSFLRDAFEFYNVPIYVEAETLSIGAKEVVIRLKGGERKSILSDTTVVSIGYITESPFDREHSNVHVIGDADKVSNLFSAIKAANDLVIKF